MGFWQLHGGLRELCLWLEFLEKRNMETIGNQFNWTTAITMTLTHCFCRSCFSPKMPCFPVFFPGSATRPERHRAAAAPVRGVLRGVAAAADAAQGGADGGQSRTARWDGITRTTWSTNYFDWAIFNSKLSVWDMTNEISGGTEPSKWSRRGLQGYDGGWLWMFGWP